MTGTVACLARSTISPWSNQRIMMPSTMRLSTCATSCTASRLPRPISLSVMNSELPPSWRMAISKLTRVRRLGLANTQAS